MQERYLIIPEWMLDLGLTTAERDAYALVWGFCQDGESDFHGSAAYVARWCGVRREAAVRILQQLVDKGLLVKTVSPGYPAHYTTQGCAILEDVRKSHTGCDNIAQGGCDNIAHNNIVPDNIEIIKTPTSPRTRELIAYGEKVRMTAEEHAKLVAEYGEEDTAALCEILDDHICAKGVTYKSHYRAIKKWCVDKLSERKLQQLRMKNAEEAAQRINGQQSKQAEGPDYAEYYRQQQRWNELLNKGKQS